MKYALVGLFLCICGRAFSQDLSGYGNNKVRIIDSGIVIQAEIRPYEKAPKTKDKLFYYWYSANQIHATQGGFSGQLLNGHYSSFYPNKNLKEQGDFKKGLKQGVWKSWNIKGELANTTNWDNGLIVNELPKPFWRKLNPFKKHSEGEMPAKPATGQ